MSRSNTPALQYLPVIRVSISSEDCRLGLGGLGLGEGYNVRNVVNNAKAVAKYVWKGTPTAVTGAVNDVRIAMVDLQHRIDKDIDTHSIVVEAIEHSLQAKLSVLISELQKHENGSSQSQLRNTITFITI